MAFVSWTHEAGKLRDAISNMDLTVQSYTADGDTLTFRSLGELRTHLAWVERMAASESGVGYGRTVAGNGGRG